jgi:hypothetical protein
MDRLAVTAAARLTIRHALHYHPDGRKAQGEVAETGHNAGTFVGAGTDNSHDTN